MPSDDAEELQFSKRRWCWYFSSATSVVCGGRYRVTDIWPGYSERICGRLQRVRRAAATACESMKLKAVGMDLYTYSRGMKPTI
jgi:hypothetical protein